MNSSSNQRSFGMDESFPPSDQRWRSSATYALSPESSESRLTTGDTGERHGVIYSSIILFQVLFYRLYFKKKQRII